VENNDCNDIRACLHGDSEAFERLVRRHQGHIARLMWRFVRDRTECERLVQDVFVEAYFSLKSYKGKAPFLHWLRKIGTRVGYRFWKEQGKAKRFLPLQDFDSIEVHEKRSIDAGKASEILHCLLARLPGPERLVLTLMYFEDCGTREIAQRTGSSRAAVKMRALRARRKIKQIAERENLVEKLGWIQ